MTSQTAKVINGSITLPRALRERWENADVLIVPADDTMVMKRIGKPLKRLSDAAERVSSAPLSQEEIADEIAAYRAGV